MKKAITILVLGLLFYQPISSASTFNSVTWLYKEIITSKDPTTFQKLVYEGEQKVNMFVNISKKFGGKDLRLKKLKAYVFTVYYEDNSPITIQATPKFKSKEKAEEQALKYGKIIGQLPTFLKKGIKTIHLNKSDTQWMSRENLIMVHAGHAATRGTGLEFHEEVMLHEAGHASISNAYFDWNDCDCVIKDKGKKFYGGKFLKKLVPEKWKSAVKADNKFVSKYAKAIEAEDFAESIFAWIMARYKKDRISEANYNKIIESIPNRLKYFDEQNYDVYPLVSK
jgi:hypothetical protein